MKIIWRGRLVRYTPLILWSCLVLFLGSGNASMARTSRIIRPLLEWLFPGSPEATLIFYHGIIRKSAHFVEYCILAMLALLAFRGSSKMILAARPYIPALLAALTVAVLDETYQSFVSTRTGAGSDVLLDMTGAVFGVLVVMVVIAVRKN